MSGRELIAHLRRRLADLDRGPSAHRGIPPDALPGAHAERPVRFHERMRVEGCDPHGAALVAGAPFDPERALYLDTETTGLSATAGTLPFLIGYAWYEAGELIVEQLLMRDPGDEAAALARLADRARSCDALVTFNGRAFDVPLLEVRYVLHRMRSPLRGLPHLDLLAPSRRMFRARLWSCRLVALEEGVLGQRREGDVAGQLIPGLYQAYLHSGDATRLREVVEHNRRDVVSMPRLLATLAAKAARPLEEAEDAWELIALGQMQLRCGDGALGVRCLEQAVRIASVPEARRRALLALAQGLRKRGDAEALAGVWDRYAREFPEENRGYEELAKVHEHRRRDLAAALDAAAAAPDSTESLRRRLLRLRARLAAREALGA